MIFLHPEKQVDVSATSEDANYPAINLFGYKPAKVWRAASGVTSATLTLTVSSGAKYVALFNTNATGATVTVKNGAGLAVENPNFGAKEGRKDYSVVHEMSSGSVYVRKRSIAKIFSGQLDLQDSDAEFYSVTDLYDYFGPLPLAMLIAEGFDDRQWACFSRFLDEVDGSHDEGISPISFNIIEVI